jgi:hypothetical protein
MIPTSITNKLDKNKVYCSQCLKTGIIKPLLKNGNNYIMQCEHKGTNFYYASWCNIDNCWSVTKGININAPKNCCLRREHRGPFSNESITKCIKNTIAAKTANGTLLNGIKAMQASYIGSDRHKVNASKTITKYNNRPEIKELHALQRSKWNKSKAAKVIESKNGKLYGAKNLLKFDRKVFYSKPLNLIRFESLNKPAQLSDIDKWYNIPGVG